jgi:two-component system, sensor histidine kinase and response regulator
MKPVKQAELLNAVLSVVAGTSNAAAASHAPAATHHSARSLQILLVEDGLANRKLAQGLLERRGHAVTVAEDGQQALDCLEHRSFDLILMDVQMPVMDGLAATRAIRARERLSGGHVPIIALTAHALKDDRQRCLDAGMDGYLTKPIRAQTLYETIESVMASPEE